MEGDFPFFTSGATILRSDKCFCDGENLFCATGGKAFVQYYNAKAAYSTDCYSFTSKSHVNAKYLYYFLDSILPIINEQMFEGAALRHLQKSKFKDILVPLPSMQEQLRIVHALDVACSAIVAAEKNTERNIKSANEMYLSCVDTLLENVEVKYGMARLGDFIDTLTDYHANGSYEVLRKNVELKDTEDFAWMVRSTDFENNFTKGFRYISKHAYSFLSKSRIYGGEILMSKIGNAGKIYLMPNVSRPCSLAMNLFLIRINDSVASNKYVFRCLKTRHGELQIRSKLKGVATQTITKDSVRGLKIPLLPRSLQDNFVSKLEEIESQIKYFEAICCKRLALLKELRTSILRKSFACDLVGAHT